LLVPLVRGICLHCFTTLILAIQCKSPVRDAVTSGGQWHCRAPPAAATRRFMLLHGWRAERPSTITDYAPAVYAWMCILRQPPVTSWWQRIQKHCHAAESQMHNKSLFIGTSLHEVISAALVLTNEITRIGQA